METNRTNSHEAATDEPAFPSTPNETLISDSLNPDLTHMARCRHDGWTPERMRTFLEVLAACGTVTDACRAAGMSPQSAYTLRNRRSSRAFAEMWDAVLIHRSRARVEGELMSRSLNGCVERVEAPDGSVRERHRYDNRLSMAMLTRLDRLAEKEQHRHFMLRALSEDFEDFLDCMETGGNLDAFVEARRPEEERETDSEEEARPSSGIECVWQDDEDGRWWTDFPPPAGFDGEEEGTCDGVSYYQRTLTAREMAVIEADHEELVAEQREDRDRYFGFEGDRWHVSTSSTSPEPPLSSEAAANAGASSERSRRGPADEAADPVSRARSTARLCRDGAEAKQVSTSSTSPREEQQPPPPPPFPPAAPEASD